MGLASVRIAFASFDFRVGMLALVTGWTVAACGVAATIRAPASRIGPLVLVAAAAWYLGGFRWVAWEPLAAVAGSLHLIWAAVIGHALATFPSGRARTARLRAIVVATYLAAIVPAPRADVLVAVGIVAALAVAAGDRSVPEPDRRGVLSVGIAFAIVLAARQVVPHALGWTPWMDTRPLLQAAFVIAAIAMTWPLVRSSRRAVRVSDLVVELGSNPRTELVAELGALVGDPDLRLGFWFPAHGRYVDALGGPVELPEPTTGRTVTRIDQGGKPLAILVHDGRLTVEPDVRVALERALELAAVNARLQADVRARVVEVAESRRRLLLAGDDERHELERQLGEGLGPRFDALEAAVMAQDLADGTVIATELQQVRAARSELIGLIEGLGPRELDGRSLAGAVAELVSRCPMPVELHVDAGELPPRTARAALFVTSEALANMAKHAGPAHAEVRVTSDAEGVSIEVVDDGRGGADPAKGSGLRGLRDRVEAMGGWLSVTSPVGTGTRVSARLPLREPRW